MLQELFLPQLMNFSFNRMVLHVTQPEKQFICKEISEVEIGQPDFLLEGLSKIEYLHQQAEFNF